MLSVGSYGGFDGAVAASAPGDRSAVVRMIRATVLFPGDPTGGTGVGAAGLALFFMAVLGFLASKDEDLPKVSLP
jgi:hypothetical protein